MKPVRILLSILALAALAAPLRAQDAPPDAAKLLADLTAANAAKDAARIADLLKPITELGASAKEQAELDPIAVELKKSLKVAKGNRGTMRSIIDAMGALRSKKTVSTLKRLAFKKKTRNEGEEELQVHAIGAIAMTRDPKLIDAFEDLSKNRSVAVAKATYEAFRHFGNLKGRVRKQAAEVLMKRLEAEYPSAAKDKSVSAEAQQRWAKLQAPIVKSLQAICRETTINDIENWREWWRENKHNHKTWKDPKKKKEP